NKLARRFSVYFYAVLAGAAMLYGALNPEYRTGVLNDDAVYVIAAHDLLSPRPLQTYLQARPDFPFPGLPFLLAPLGASVDPHWTLLESVSVVATLLSIALLGLWLKSWMSPEETLTIMALYAFNPLVARYSGIVMPGPYITLATVAGFYQMSRVLRNPT